MRKVFGALILSVSIVIFTAPSAMAVHKCGQLLGSCLVHLDPTPIIKPKYRIQIQPVRKPIEAIRPAREISPKQCFKRANQGYLISIPCGSGKCFKETNGYLLLISCTRR